MVSNDDQPVMITANRTGSRWIFSSAPGIVIYELIFIVAGRYDDGYAVIHPKFIDMAFDVGEGAFPLEIPMTLAISSGGNLGFRSSRPEPNLSMGSIF